MCLSYFKPTRHPFRPILFILAVFVLISLAASPAHTAVSALIEVAAGTTVTNNTDYHYIGGLTRYGIFIRDGGSITNTGDITLQYTNPMSSFFGVYADYTTHTLVNHGDISVSTSVAGIPRSAYGIYNKAGTLNLTNTGMITASGVNDNYELTVQGTTVLVDTYNITLDGDPSTGSIRLSGGTLHLNNAALTASYVDNEIQWDTAYKIFDGAGTIDGNFSSVTAVNPNVTVAYNDQGTPDFFDDTLSLTYAADTNTTVSAFPMASGLTLKTLALAGGTLDQRMVTSFLSPTGSGTSVLVADSGAIASDGGKGYLKSQADRYFFFTPYYTHLSRSADPSGYEANSGGASFGLERRTKDILYGFHLGGGVTDIDYRGTGLNGNNEDQKLFTSGLHTMGRVGEWTFRGRVTPFFAQSDYQGLTGLNLTDTETADYNTYGFASSLVGGYLFKFKNHILMPEVGLDYMYTHRQGFTTDATDSAYNLACDSLDMHQVTATADLQWTTRLDQGAWQLTPSATAGVRVLLSDNEVAVRQTISGGDPFTVSSFQDDIAATLSLSLGIQTGGPISTEIAYDGEYGEDTTRHSLWTKFSVAF